jgi:hypothetical protein
MVSGRTQVWRTRPARLIVFGYAASKTTYKLRTHSRLQFLDGFQSTVEFGSQSAAGCYESRYNGVYRTAVVCL